MSSSILDLVGNTPIIKLNNITKDLKGVSIYAKAEFLNPSGSIKDRAAKAIFLEAITSKKLTKDKILLDSTSGNTGIAYAMFGAALGYKVSLTLPSNANFERKKILKAYGATIIETDPLLSSDGALLEAKKIARENPHKYYVDLSLELWQLKQDLLKYYIEK